MHIGDEVWVPTEADGDDVINGVGWCRALRYCALRVVVKYPSPGFEVAWVFEVVAVC